MNHHQEARGREQGAWGMEKEPIKSNEDLEAYKMAFDVAMKIFDLSKKFAFIPPPASLLKKP